MKHEFGSLWGVVASMRLGFPTVGLIALCVTACTGSDSAPTATPGAPPPTSQSSSQTPEPSLTTPSPTPVSTPSPAPTVLSATSIATEVPTATLSLTSTPAAMSPPSVQQPVVAEMEGDIPSYRREDWRHWTDEDGDCQNARHEVLQDESLRAVTFTSSTECSVLHGYWIGVFTNTIVETGRDLDVDHMVPLKNAHDSGGWAWDAAKKEAYANDLSDPDHLIAVTASANRSKGASGPENWKPTNTDYWCDYAVDWIRIKNTWDLTVTPAEWEALESMLQTCAGGSSPLVVTAPTLSPTSSPVPVVAASPSPAPTPSPSNCDPSYPDSAKGTADGKCIPIGAADYDCAAGSGNGPNYVSGPIRVLPPDPHRLDTAKDGVGCE